MEKKEIVIDTLKSISAFPRLSFLDGLKRLMM